MKNYFRDFIVSPINTGLQNIQNFFKTTNGSNIPAHANQDHQDGSKRNRVIRMIVSIILMLILAIAVLWRPIKALFNMFFNNTNVQPVKPEESNAVNTPATEAHAADINLAVSHAPEPEAAPPVTNTIAVAITPMRNRRCGAAAVAAARATEKQASTSHKLGSQ